MCREHCKNVLKIVITGAETQARAEGDAQKLIINCKNAFNVWQILFTIIKCFFTGFFYGVCKHETKKFVCA